MINNNEKRAKATPAMENRTDTVFIKDIHVGMKNFTITCIVLEVGPPVLLKENREVRTIKVADQTACINLTVWDDAGHFINASDIIRLTRAYATLFRNSLTLYTSKTGTLEKIGEFCMVFNDQLNMSELVVQTPQPPPPNNPPNGNNNNTNNNSSNDSNSSATSITSNATTAATTTSPANTNASTGYNISRNLAQVANSSYGAGPPSHSAGGSSRYDGSGRNNSRNGQQGDDPSSNVVNPRNRSERR